MTSLNKEIAEKEKELILQGIDPDRMVLVLSGDILFQMGKELTTSTRFQGFYGRYLIETSPEVSQIYFKVLGTQ